jgi:hypothetical protein
MTTRSHQPGCTLYSVHWLRHAVAASGHLANPDPDELSAVDRTSAGLLADTLSHFAELPDWESVTLLDVAEHATPMAEDDRFSVHCTCRRA